MRHNKIYLDSRQYVDKHLRKKDKEAKRKEITEKKEERHYEWMAHVVDHFSKYHVLWAHLLPVKHRVKLFASFCFFVFYKNSKNSKNNQLIIKIYEK